MEILILVLLYYLSQNPDFSESVKPIMEKLKNSEQMLAFLKDLSNFSKTFSTFQSAQPPKNEEKSNVKTEEKKEKPQASTEGIADDFIQNILNTYLQQH